MRKNIVILTSANPFLTSGKTALDVKSALEISHNVKIISRRYFKSTGDIISIQTKFNFFLEKITNKLKKKFLKSDKLNKNYFMFSYKKHLKNNFYKKVLKKIPNTTDIIVYIFCVDFLNEEELFIINNQKKTPIIRIMIDMAEITGGCHFSWDCKGYQINCGNCPGLFSKDSKDLTYQNLLNKKKYINLTDISIVAVSNQQYNQLQSSSIYNKTDKYKFLLPIDNSIFFNKNKEESRKFFKLPNNKTIIMFGAVNALEKRKGGKELFESLNYLKKNFSKNIIESLHLIIAGNFQENHPSLLGFDYTVLGYLSYENLSTAYNAADVYLCTSIQDSGPSMINQSIMCGTPVISFDIGVSRDLIINDKTGYIVKYKNTIGLAKAIELITKKSNYELKVMSDNCIKIAKEKCSYNVFNNNINDIIYSIFNKKKIK